MIRIAIAGNPNSGKTTLFNSLSGRNERVGNWAGVTVEKKEAILRRRYNTLHEDVVLVDLPGAYSMDAYTNDELEATRFLKNEKIDVIINVVDASNLERSLHFTSQLMESGIPVVVALNKSDIIRRRNTKIDPNVLVELMGIKAAHFTQATCKRGLTQLVDDALNQVEKRENYEKSRAKKRHKRHRFQGTNKKCRCR